jgi:hypothetical protein
VAIFHEYSNPFVSALKNRMTSGTAKNQVMKWVMKLKKGNASE